MTKNLAILLESTTFKKIYSVIFLVLLVLGVYIVIDPKPFLKFGLWGVFVFNTLGGFGTYLIPILSQRMNLLSLALVTALGMSINDSVSWLIGHGGTAIFSRGRLSHHVENLINRNEFWALFILSMLPLPYDIIGIICGYLGITYRGFIIPTFLGKFLRVIIIGLGTREIISLFL